MTPAITKLALADDERVDYADPLIIQSEPFRLSANGRRVGATLPIVAPDGSGAWFPGECTAAAARRRRRRSLAWSCDRADRDRC